METTTLSFANLHQHGELFANMLRARKRSFIERRKWDLPISMGMEYDQYDTPASRWVVVHDENGDVLAGTRLTPTTAKCGIYTYMIRDAQRGLLDTIPQNLLWEEAPVHETEWESSRLFVHDKIPASERKGVYIRLVLELRKAARDLGATRCVALLSVALPRLIRRQGVIMTPIGPAVMIDGTLNNVVSMDLAYGRA
ncbi:N-acyl-L-homoserine lactone synthetase [Palleronia aestuarii]|uniref:acyl-homoserine-lactone synthase n=1 Tax=Palleronia aestuarii TaxID=568105 RepID=A0A2W7MWW7_9RHOB|nr:acyl-homoserine-lactone synthase [Palleronia aestuarii]PZX12280.1 N-acyl-L-homoserine lactone synthetase [Palleronia aestuarii]